LLLLGSITLHGHNGPIYGLSFSPDRSLLLSCSEDGTIRLWSLQTWTCLVNYKVKSTEVILSKSLVLGEHWQVRLIDCTFNNFTLLQAHLFPVWQVKFSHHGHYFVSCGHDKTVKLWTTEQSSCLRVFVGHFSDVDCVAFHPNSNYVASGSSDRSVRLW